MRVVLKVGAGREERASEVDTVFTALSHCPFLHSALSPLHSTQLPVAAVTVPTAAFPSHRTHPPQTRHKHGRKDGGKVLPHPASHTQALTWGGAAACVL